MKNKKSEGKKNPKHTIIGIIIPAEWDDKERVTKIAIQTINEEEYIVEPNNKGKELFSFINNRVSAQGTTQTRSDGKSVITIQSYKTKGWYGDDNDTYRFFGIQTS